MSLPSDILIMVFAFLVPASLDIHEIWEADSWEHGFKYDTDCPCSTDHADLVAVSQVCRLWRDITVGCPSFWNPIWITDHDNTLGRAPEFLDRVRDMPLEVAVVDRVRSPYFPERIHLHKHECPVGPLFHPMVSFLNFQHSHDIASFIKVLRITTSIPPTSEGFFDLPLPLLETLMLEYLDVWMDYPYHLPVPLFGGQTPNLRKMSLKQAKFSWDDTLLKNLTFLRLWGCDERWSATPSNNPKATAERFFRVMSDCPNLVTLDLAFVGPLIQENFSPASRVTLPHLRHLILSGMVDFTTCHALLSGLQLPGLQRLHVSHLGFAPTHVDMLLPVEFSFNPIISRTVLMDASLHWSTSMFEVNFVPDQATLEACEGSSFCTNVPRGGNRVMDELDVICKFHYEAFDGGVPAFAMFYVSFLRRFCSPQTPELSLCDLGNTSHDEPFDAEALFAHFKAVRWLEVRNGVQATGATLCSVLAFLKTASESADSSNDETVALALPSLSKISLYDVDLSSGIDDLCVFLRHRKGRQVQLEELEFIRAKNVPPPNASVDLNELVEYFLVLT